MTIQELRNSVLLKYRALIGSMKEASAIENGVWSYINEMYPSLNRTLDKVYLAKARQVYGLIKQRHDICIIDIPLDRIAYVPYHDIIPMKWKEHKQQVKLLDQEIIGLRNKTEKNFTTSIFTCPRCKKNNCKSVEVQTRSCDESATVFVTCIECNYSFRN